jgi:hypothetical protein
MFELRVQINWASTTSAQLFCEYFIATFHSMIIVEPLNRLLAAIVQLQLTESRGSIGGKRGSRCGGLERRPMVRLGHLYHNSSSWTCLVNWSHVVQVHRSRLPTLFEGKQGIRASKSN